MEESTSTDTPQEARGEGQIESQSLQRNYGYGGQRKQPFQDNTPEKTPEKSPEKAPEKESQPYQAAYQAALPYPLIKPDCKNPQYAAAMLDNMGGVNSEISAVSLYFYDHLITGEYREAAETFHHVAIVEMHHLEIFGSLALRLGENPRLWSRRNRGRQYLYWSPAYLHYPPFPLPPAPQDGADCGCCSPSPCPPLKKLLAEAIESEQEALNKYMKQTNWIQDVNVCDNLRRIAADEQMHIDIFTRLYHQF